MYFLFRAAPQKQDILWRLNYINKPGGCMKIKEGHLVLVLICVLKLDQGQKLACK